MNINGEGKKWHNVQITLDQDGYGSVKLDGVHLDTTAVTFESHAGQPTMVRITMVATVTVDADVPLTENRVLTSTP